MEVSMELVFFLFGSALVFSIVYGVFMENLHRIFALIGGVLIQGASLTFGIASVKALNPCMEYWIFSCRTSSIFAFRNPTEASRSIPAEPELE